MPDSSSKRKKDRSGTPACSAHILKFIKTLGVKEVPANIHLCLLVIVDISSVIKCFFFLYTCITNKQRIKQDFLKSRIYRHLCLKRNETLLHILEITCTYLYLTTTLTISATLTLLTCNVGNGICIQFKSLKYFCNEN